MTAPSFITSHAAVLPAAPDAAGYIFPKLSAGALVFGIFTGDTDDRFHQPQRRERDDIEPSAGADVKFGDLSIISYRVYRQYRYQHAEKVGMVAIGASADLIRVVSCQWVASSNDRVFSLYCAQRGRHFLIGLADYRAIDR